MNKQEAIKKLESIKVIGNDAIAACYNESINAGITLMKKIDESQITDEQAWNKIAESYPESAQSLRNTLDNVVFGKAGEPQKPVVPKFVADWIELCKEKADLISCLSGSYEYGVNQYKRITEDEDWLFEADHQELVARAWLDGYEVEKEPLYYVRLPYEVWDEEAAELKTEYLYLHYEITSDETRIFPTKEPRKGFVAKLDELTIKSADENYWPFAVPVEEAEA
ncbi:MULTISPECIES: DUF1642 domain-containing protein [Enterococcus]|nr:MULTISPECIES: DUF1642 domain-containing protein [Enterococcus]GER76644.1 hypothetical protein EsFM111_14260 [Enterococcus sp. FM11-1]